MINIYLPINQYGRYAFHDRYVSISVYVHVRIFEYLLSRASQNFHRPAESQPSKVVKPLIRTDFRCQKPFPLRFPTLNFIHFSAPLRIHISDPDASLAFRWTTKQKYRCGRDAPWSPFPCSNLCCNNQSALPCPAALSHHSSPPPSSIVLSPPPSPAFPSFPLPSLLTSPFPPTPPFPPALSPPSYPLPS